MIKPKIISLILAGGSGSRMQSAVPKQFVEIGDKPLFLHTLENFIQNERISEHYIVCQNAHIKTISGFIPKNVNVLPAAGETRQQTCGGALSYLRDKTESDTIVLIHDAARPLVSQRIIDDNISAAIKYNAATTAILSNDSLFSSNGEFYGKPISREGVYYLQTPQTFRFDLIDKAHEKARNDSNFTFTDDATLFLCYINENIAIVQGEKKNFKITTAEDVWLFERLIK